MASGVCVCGSTATIKYKDYKHFKVCIRSYTQENMQIPNFDSKKQHRSVSQHTDMYVCEAFQVDPNSEEDISVTAAGVFIIQNGEQNVPYYSNKGVKNAELIHYDALL